MRKFTSIAALFVGVLIWAPVLGWCQGNTSHTIMVVAHAGGAGYHVHNTKSAILSALDMKADVIEFDIQDTKDHIPVLHHDFVIQADEAQLDNKWLSHRTSFIKDITLDELRRYNIAQVSPGSPSEKSYPFRKHSALETILTLDAALALISQSPFTPQVFIEVKSALDLGAGYPAETLVQDVLMTIRKYNVSKKISIISFDWRVLNLVHQAEPSLKTVYIFRDPLMYAREFSDDMKTLGVDIAVLTPDKIINRLTDGMGVASHYALYANYIKNHGGWMLDAYKEDAEPAMMEQAQKLGLKTGVWTVDTLTETAKAVAQGVDAITTNYPDIVASAVKEGR